MEPDQSAIEVKNPSSSDVQASEHTKELVKKSKPTNSTKSDATAAASKESVIKVSEEDIEL